jgi:hypothetical protein
MSELVEVYRATSVPQAYLVRGFLEQAGIPAVIDREATDSQLPLGWSTAPRVLVAAENAAYARSLIDAVEAAAEDEPLPDWRDDIFPHSS